MKIPNVNYINLKLLIYCSTIIIRKVFKNAYFIFIFFYSKKKSTALSPGTCSGWPGSSFAHGYNVIIYISRQSTINSLLAYSPPLSHTNLIIRMLTFLAGTFYIPSNTNPCRSLDFLPPYHNLLCGELHY
jgi:hypothetical protein